MGYLRRLRMIADDGTGSYDRVRVGARAILLREGRILLSHEREKDFWCLPGGGHEEGESLEETCRREVAEETGVDVRVGEKFVIVDSCFHSRRFENHFFFCEFLGHTSRHRTEEERMNDLQPEWVPLEEAIAIFSDTGAHAENRMFVGCYERDFRILSLVKKQLLEEC